MEFLERDLKTIRGGVSKEVVLRSMNTGLSPLIVVYSDAKTTMHGIKITSLSKYVDVTIEDGLYRLEGSSGDVDFAADCADALSKIVIMLT